MEAYTAYIGEAMNRYTKEGTLVQSVSGEKYHIKYLSPVLYYLSGLILSTDYYWSRRCCELRVAYRPIATPTTLPGPRRDIQLNRLPNTVLFVRQDAAVIRRIKPSLICRGARRADDPPLMRWSIKKLGIASPLTASGVTVVFWSFCAECSRRGGPFEDGEKEGSEGGDAGCDDEDEDFVARCN